MLFCALPDDFFYKEDTVLIFIFRTIKPDIDAFNTWLEDFTKEESLKTASFTHDLNLISYELNWIYHLLQRVKKHALNTHSFITALYRMNHRFKYAFEYNQN